ncbi:MAG: hypothetical protein M1282_12935 [Chloroflexi bacterium]|nr:hypothetical protein [Chloroflexota bacterium]
MFKTSIALYKRDDLFEKQRKSNKYGEENFEGWEFSQPSNTDHPILLLAY